jgi:3-deoxy-D-manno-octulosonic-acid transferase
METEIWPNLMAAAGRARVPMLLANARLSARSLVAARRWPSLMRPAARGFARILAQTDADAKRLALLTETEDVSPSAITVAGNVKFDTEVAASQRVVAEVFRARLQSGMNASSTTRVFLCASTRDGEEERILDAWRQHARGQAPAGIRLLLVIVPRHPQRFDAVVALAAARDLRVQRRSDDAALAPDTDVWIGDSMGELAAYYLSADLAYVGGSILPLGGQNLIEAAACGCPILLGRHTFNFAAASDDAVRAGAALRVGDFDQLVLKGVALLVDEQQRRRMREAGLAFAAAHRGATARTVAVVEEILRSRSEPAAMSGP